MNDLIKNADHIHYILSKALIKYHEGKQLTEEEEMVLVELYEAKEEGCLKEISEINVKPNIVLKYIVMSGVPGMHKNKNRNLGPAEAQTELPQPTRKYELDQEILSLDGKTFPDSSSSYVLILDIIQKGGNINDIYKFCQDKLMEHPLTLRTAFMTAVGSSKKNNGRDRDSYESFELRKKIYNNAKLTIEDLASIKSAVKEVYTHPDIVGFIFDFIEKK